MDDTDDTKSNLRVDPLGQPLAGALLRCGGVVRRGAFTRTTCGVPFLLTEPYPATGQELHERLQPHGWVLALASLGGQGSAVVDGKLYVAGTPVYDPLCPKCAKNLLSRLSAEGS